MTKLPEKRSAVNDAADLLAAVAHTDDGHVARVRRPAAILGGSILVWLRAGGGLLWLAGFAIELPKVAHEFGLTAEEHSLILGLVAAVDVAWVALLVVLAWLVLRGSNVARMLVMTGTTLSIVLAAVDYFTAGDAITVRTTLLTLTLDILILLALSSKDARAWSRGRRGSRRKNGSAAEV